MAISQHETIDTTLSGNSTLTRTLELKASRSSALVIEVDQTHTVRFNFYETNSFSNSLASLDLNVSASAGTATNNTVDMASPYGEIEIKNDTSNTAEVTGTVHVR